MRTTHIPWLITLSPLSVALAYQMASLGRLVRSSKNDSLTRMNNEQPCAGLFSARKKGTHIPDSGTLRFDGDLRTKAAITAITTVLTATGDKGGDCNDESK